MGHEPQCCGLLVMSTQPTVGQQKLGAAHAGPPLHWQLPATHWLPCTPHEGAHVVAMHWPPMHVCVDGHMLVHEPQ